MGPVHGSIKTLSPVHGAPSLQTLFKARLGSVTDSSIIGFYDRSTCSWKVETQRDLLAKAATSSVELEQAGVTASQPILIVCSSPRSVLLGFTAALFAGAIPAILPMRPAFDSREVVAKRIADMAALLGHDTAVIMETRADGKPSLESPGYLKTIQLDAKSLEPIADPRLMPIGGASAISHIQLTSGSTGNAKGIAVSQAGLLANINALKNRGGVTPYDVFVSWLPLYHDMGLVSQALMSLVLGVDCYLMSPFDFLANPLEWVRAISDKGATFVLSPNFGYQLVTTRATDTDLESIDLSRWRSAYCGAEPISADVARAFYDRFAGCGLRAEAFTPSYGLAEATLAVSAVATNEHWRSISVTRDSLARLGKIEIVEHQVEHQIDGEDTQISEVVSLGRAVDGLEISLVDADGQLIDNELACGEVVVQGSSVAAGWIDDNGKLSPFGASGLHTGDVGFFHDGELFIVDRIKNIVIRNGQNYSAQALEKTLAELACVDVDNVMVFDRDIANGRGLTAVVELERHAEPRLYLQAILQGIDRFEPPLESIVFAKPGALLRTTSGKKRHIAVRGALDQGVFPAIESHDVIDLVGTSRADGEVTRALAEAADEQRLVGLVAKHVRARDLDVPVVLTARLQHDLDFDSLALFDLVAEIEDEFDKEIPFDALGNLKTVGDILDVLRSDQAHPQEGARILEMLEIFGEDVPQRQLVVERQVGRRLQIEGRWIDDFASLNFLGFSMHDEIRSAAGPFVEEWGLHPGWPRVVASPHPFHELETRLAELIDVPDTVIFPTSTLAHFGVIPKLANKNAVILLDQSGHHSMHEAASLASAHGATVRTYRHGDHEALERKLAELQHKQTRLICTNGVGSMAGYYTDLPDLVRLAHKYDAYVYVDDAHGLGVVGEGPTSAMPYGLKGNGLVKHYGMSYERVIYMSTLCKAFTSTVAFVACADETQRSLFQASSTHVFGGPVSNATIATAIAALDVNEREGDSIRDRLWRLASRVIGGLAELGLHTDNDTGFPVFTIVVGNPERTVEACNYMWEQGFLVTPSIFPAAPLERGGVRISVTALHTDEQIERLLAALQHLKAAVSHPTTSRFG